MTSDNSRSLRRLVTTLNVLFGLIAVGIFVGVTKYLLFIVGLWAIGATRISAVAIALAAYVLLFVLSLVMCLRSKPAGRTSGKTVAWALSPLLGLLWIMVSTSYLFGICNFNPFRCIAPVFHKTTPAPIDSARSAMPPAAPTVLLPSGIGANGQPVKTFGGSKGEIARNRIIDIHACTDQRERAWFNDDDHDHRPEARRQKMIEFSEACAALIDGTETTPAAPKIESSDAHGSKTSETVSAAPSQPKIFRCPGPAGTTAFSDMPCPSANAN
jgi:hypothetical protein